MNMDPRGRKQANPLTNRSIMRNFPKIELHRHLEGTFELKTLYKIAKKNGIDVPSSLKEFRESVQFPNDSPPDFLLFLSKFRNDWYRSLDDVSEITYASVKEIAKDSVYYIELRFNPDHFASVNNWDHREITKLIIEAGNKAAKDVGFQIKYLITFNRSKLSQPEMFTLYNSITSLNLKDIVGIDLAGDELNYPPELFQDFFDHVNTDNKYSMTIHAGEVSPSIQIWNAIDLLHAKRIGHGTSSISDPKLQQTLIDRKITLEQCLTSNYQTGSWPDTASHPLGRLFRLGVPVTINTDDPHIQDSDLTEDYIKVVKNFDFDLDDLIAINQIAIDAVFLPDAEKELLRKGYLAAVKTFRKRFAL